MRLNKKRLKATEGNGMIYEFETRQHRQRRFGEIWKRKRPPGAEISQRFRHFLSRMATMHRCRGALATVLLLLLLPYCAYAWSRAERLDMRKRVHGMVDHAYNSYMDFAFPRMRALHALYWNRSE